MKDPKKLAFVLSILKSLPADNDTESFWREVAKIAGNAVSKDKSEVVGDWFSAITIEDIHRIKQYLTLRDKILRSNARKFYRRVIDKSLKHQLMVDFQAMKLALIDNDSLEYGRRLGMQLENCFSYVMVKTDAWTVVNTDDQYLGIKKFFYKDGIRVRLGLITMPIKRSYCERYYGFVGRKVFYANKSFDDVVFLRNQASHRGSASTDEKARFSEIEAEQEKNINLQTFMLIRILENLDDLYR